MNNPEIFVDRCPYADRVDLRLRDGRLTINGDIVKRGMWMKEPIFVKVEEGATPPIAMSLSMEGAQALMDRLWKAGLRPTEGSGSAGALAATERHLVDMQTLVFEKPKRSLGRLLTPEEERKIFDPEVYRKTMSEI